MEQTPQSSLEKLENIIVAQASTKYENQFLFHNSVYHSCPKQIYNLLHDAFAGLLFLKCFSLSFYIWTLLHLFA